MQRPMGAAADRDNRFKERARVSGERPKGAAHCRDHCTSVHLGIMPRPFDHLFP